MEWNVEYQFDLLFISYILTVAHILYNILPCSCKFIHLILFKIHLTIQTAQPFCFVSVLQIMNISH